MNNDLNSPCQTSLNTGMAWAILSEIATLLTRLAEKGERSSIDLRSLPLTGADRHQLQELLGRGEVSATLNVLGKTEIWETQFSGVWWIRHMGAGDKVSSEEIAVTPHPEILQAHPADIGSAAERLNQQLAGRSAGQSHEEEATHV